MNLILPLKKENNDRFIWQSSKKDEGQVMYSTEKRTSFSYQWCSQRTNCSYLSTTSNDTK
jgi:hypothetical protein